jgi:hypothetical protein
MPYTQTIILHITQPDDAPNPTTWPWDAQLDLRLIDTINNNEFVLEDWEIYEQSLSTTDSERSDN